MIRSVKESAFKLLYNKHVKKHMEKIPYVRRIYTGWKRAHPFDLQYGVDTSGFVPAEQIHSDTSLTRQISPYVGSQPSIIRKALSKLPDPQDYIFIDLGCGKGRGVIVASEFSFREVMGVELSPHLVKIAERNIHTIKQQFPQRPFIIIVEGNAVNFTFPKGKLVLFMYHAFGRELMSQLINAVESALLSSTEHMFIVYYNPVWGDLLDRSQALTRWYAETIPYDASEIGYGPDTEDTVVIWQSVRAAYPASHSHADRRIAITQELWKAGLSEG